VKNSIFKRKNIFSAILCILTIALCSFASHAHPAAGTSVAFLPALLPSQNNSMYNRYIYSFLNQIFNYGASQGSALAIQQSLLRIEQNISNGTNVYTFNPQANPSSDAPEEVKLVQNDVFVATGIAMYLYQYVLSGTNQQREQQVWQTYPNATYFAAGTSFNAKFLYAFYKGFYSYKVGSAILSESIPTDQFLYIPTVQQGTVTAELPVNYSTSGTVAAQTSTQANSAYSLDAILKPLNPWLFFNGFASNGLQLQIKLDAADVPANDNSNTTNVVGTRLDGFLIKNGQAAWDSAMDRLMAVSSWGNGVAQDIAQMCARVKA
jgi:hypothetical protein